MFVFDQRLRPNLIQCLLKHVNTMTLILTHAHGKLSLRTCNTHTFVKNRQYIDTKTSFIGDGG